MSRAFIHGIKNYKDMNHNVYNVGDNNLNWTKAELSEYIAEKTGAIVHYAEIGQDSDQRDYEVDYSKINNDGFKCNVTMQEGIEQLIKVTPLLQIRHQYS